MRSIAPAASLLVALAGTASAQLVSSWAAPAFDDGNPSPDPVNTWLTDTTTGDVVDLPNVFGARALAADNARGRIYTAGNASLITFVADPTSSPDGIRELDERIPIRDAAGNTIGRPSAMGFARGQIYAFAPAGFFAIDPDTGLATPLPRPIEGRSFAGIDYNPDDGLMYAVTGFFPNEEIIAFDLDTFTVSPVAVVPESIYNFAALGSYNFDGVAVGEGKVFLTTSLSDQFGSLRTAVYDIGSGAFSTLPNPARRGENRSYPGGATYFTGLQDPEPRRVQVRSVDFGAQVIELFNFSSADVDLSGWRFCSHDFDEQRRYTAPGGFDGVAIEAGTSVFVHLNDDAPAGDPDRVNRADLSGGFALPLDQDAFGLQLFNPDENGNVSFGNSALIADHIQWNTGGADTGLSETRTGQAVGEGLWSATGDFIATEPGSTRIDLTDLSGDEAGSPGEYAVIRPGTVHNEAVDGDLSDDAGAPSPLAFGLGSNVVEGEVNLSNDPDNGDRDFITFDVPSGRAVAAIALLAWDPDNIGFIAINAGATGFVPSGDTDAEFLSGVLVGAGNVGTDLLVDFRDSAVTLNSLGEARLDAGTYTVVVQQTSDLTQSYALDFVLSEAGCNDADLAAPFGVLDLADVNAFIGGFVNADAIADLTGDGVFDLSDIQAFIDAIVAGCP